MSIYFVPVGIQRTRLNIMHRGTSKIGLKLAENYNNNVQYIVSELESFEKVVKNLKITGGEIVKANIVKTTWFFDSLKSGYPLPCSTYLIKPDKNQVKYTVNEKIRDKYLCQNPTLLNHKNKKFVTALEILAQDAEMQTDDVESSRALAFRKAAGALKQFPKEIESVAEVSRMADIGQHSRTIVQEIIKTSFSEEVKKVESSHRFQTLKLFTSIYGIGPAKAGRLYNEGLRTLDDIKQCTSLKIDDRIRFGLQYHNDLSSPVTKDEAERVYNLVSVETERVEPGCKLYLMGGFSRGKQTGHDIDILISHPDDGKDIGLLEKICLRLQKKGLVLHQVIDARKTQLKRGSTIDNFDKCFAILKLTQCDDVSQTCNEKVIAVSKIWMARRVDLIVCPHNELPYALVGWTGSKLFNRSLRHYAKKELNLKLTSHYLYDLSTNSHVFVNSEEELFSKLHLPYLKPHERNL